MRLGTYSRNPHEPAILVHPRDKLKTGKKIMKNTAIITTMVLFSFGWGQNMKPPERLISQLPQEVQALFTKTQKMILLK
jgi:hypothetical protein